MFFDLFVILLVQLAEKKEHDYKNIIIVHVLKKKVKIKNKILKIYLRLV